MFPQEPRVYILKMNRLVVPEKLRHISSQAGMIDESTTAAAAATTGSSITVVVSSLVVLPFAASGVGGSTFGVDFLVVLLATTALAGARCLVGGDSPSFQ